MPIMSILFSFILSCFVFLASADSLLLLIADRKSIRVLDVTKNESTIIVEKADDACGLDYVYSQGWVFWSDVGSHRIYRAPIPPGLFAAGTGSPFSSPSPNYTHHVVAENDIGQVDGLACDWLSHKIYWSDSQKRLIEVAELDGSHRKDLYWTGLQLPRSLALVPTMGLLFWTDWGDQPRIERASMDGDQVFRHTILSGESLGWPNGITVDVNELRLYFSDARVARIVSANFEGGDLRVVQRFEGQPYSVAVVGAMVYWTDWQSHSIVGSFKNGHGHVVLTNSDLSTNALDLRVFSSNTQASNFTSPCQVNNGGCSHLCLLSARSSKAYSCACPSGVRMLEDLATCEPYISDMLLVAHKDEIKAISLDTSDHIPRSLPLSDMTHAISVTYDPIEEFVYWIDDQERTLSRSRLDGSARSTIIDTDLFTPDGIAIDYIARNLYFVEAEAQRIQVALLSGAHRKTLFSKGLRSPRGIALFSAGGWLYWTDWGSGRIERGYLDGSFRQTLVKTDLIWPNGLALDIENRKMYWCDAKTHRIDQANLDGTFRRVLLDEIPHAFGMAVYGGYLYWSEWQRGTIERYHLKNHKHERVSKISSDVMMIWAGPIRSHNYHLSHSLNNSVFLTDGLSAPTNANRSKIQDSCENGGNCSHFCLSSPMHRRICSCPDDMKLAEDGRSCFIEPAQLLVATVEGKLSRVMIANTSLTKLHGSNVSKALGSIDYHWKEGILFFVDTIQNTICKTFMAQSGRVDVIIKFGVGHVASLTVDWLAGNLYWTDSDLGRIEVSRLNGSYRKIILWNELDPSVILVDPVGQQLYWANEFGRVPRIEKSRLDGTKRSRLVGTAFPARSMSMDTQGKRLFWTDGENIESVDVSGKARHALTWSTAFRANRITVYEDLIFLSESEKVFSAPLNQPNQAIEVYTTDNKSISDLKVYHPSLQSGWNFCVASNGGCAALCFATGGLSINQARTCACATHYNSKITKYNEKVCTLSQNILFFTQRTSISRVLLDDYGSNIVLPITVHNVHSLNFDPYTGYLFWLDTNRRLVLRARDDGSDYAVVFEPRVGNRSGFIDFVFDPLTKHMLWINVTENSINIARMMPQGDFKQLGVIIVAKKPRHLAIHSRKSLLIFVDLLDQGDNRIMGCIFDGSNLHTIFQGNKNILVKPVDITIDAQDNVVYWSDLALSTIECVSLDGDQHMVLVQNFEAFALAVYDTELFAISRVSQEIAVFNRRTGVRQSPLLSRRTHLLDLLTIPEGLPNAYAGRECSCSHVCLIYGEREPLFSCSCPLHHAEGSCKVDTCGPQEWTCPNGLIAMTGGLQPCISLNSRCDARTDCMDGSDEIGCCASEINHFKCSSHEQICVADKNVCDGHKDCPDGSDEKDCESRECAPSNEVNEYKEPRFDGGSALKGAACCEGGLRCQKISGRFACLHSSKICNDAGDCQDRTDELHCCGLGLFQCHTRQGCISAARVCDGAADCEDGSDEIDCCLSTCAKSTLGLPNTAHGDPNMFLVPVGGESGITDVHWPVIFVGASAFGIVLITLFCFRRDSKAALQDPAVALHLQTSGHRSMTTTHFLPSNASAEEPFTFSDSIGKINNKKNRLRISGHHYHHHVHHQAATDENSSIGLAGVAAPPPSTTAESKTTPSLLSSAYALFNPPPSPATDYFSYQTIPLQQYNAVDVVGCSPGAEGGGVCSVNASSVLRTGVPPPPSSLTSYSSRGGVYIESDASFVATKAALSNQRRLARSRSTGSQTVASPCRRLTVSTVQQHPGGLSMGASGVNVDCYVGATSSLPRSATPVWTEPEYGPLNAGACSSNGSPASGAGDDDSDAPLYYRHKQYNLNLHRLDQQQRPTKTPLSALSHHPHKHRRLQRSINRNKLGHDEDDLVLLYSGKRPSAIDGSVIGAGYRPPPASPIPSERSFLYCDPASIFLPPHQLTPAQAASVRTGARVTTLCHPPVHTQKQKCMRDA